MEQAGAGSRHTGRAVQGEQARGGGEEERRRGLEASLVQWTNYAMDMADEDGDGYITYDEYAAADKKAKKEDREKEKKEEEEFTKEEYQRYKEEHGKEEEGVE